MVIVDKPRHLIVLTAGHFFGTGQQADEDIEDREILDRFLEQSSCRTLCARPVDENRLKLTTEVPAGRNTLVFFKVRNKQRVSAMSRTMTFHQRGRHAR